MSECPNCGAAVPEGAFVCPRCRTEMGVTQRLTRLSSHGALWCPDCGALVPEGADACPKCGHSFAEPKDPRPVRDLPLPDFGNTGVMEPVEAPEEPRIESAIPSVDAPLTVNVHDKIPRPRVFVTALALAVCVVGGAALAITHPWDPNATRISATTPADLSQQGFPGTINTLTGQDNRGGQSSDADPYEDLHAAWQNLRNLSARIDSCEDDLRSVGLSGTLQERTDAQQTELQAALDTSNAITELEKLADSSSPYYSQLKNLKTLGSWLRNRCDALSEAWELSVGASDPSSQEEKVLSLVSESEGYAQLFEQSYAGWEPTQVAE